jgi:hypothetical protein
LNEIAALNPGLQQNIASIITVEARHDAFFRISGGVIPNPAPFDTGLTAAWAYNLAQPFIVPGSCPSLPLPILPALTVSANPGATMAQIEFDPSQVDATKPLFVGWVNQANAPVYTALNLSAPGKGNAAMPPNLENVAFVALARDQFGIVDDLSSGTVAGPAVFIAS